MDRESWQGREHRLRGFRVLSDPTLVLPFDQYQRYRLVADIIGKLRKPDEKLVILDVGGRTALLRKFLPDDSVHLVDVEESEVDELVLGDGSCLPFATDSVDAVVTFDTLEHVPAPLRVDFLKECRRVAKRWVVVAGPYATEGVAQAESMLEDFLQGKMELKHRYLAEHKANGLPLLEQSEKILGGKGGSVASIGHANLSRWLGLMCLELYMDRDPQLRSLAAEYYAYYNKVLYASDYAAPVYRHAVVGVYDGTPIPSQLELLGEPIAPTGSFEPFSDLIRKLCDFDLSRDVVIPEWERLEKVNTDLHLDLEGHRTTLLILEDNNREQGEVIQELRNRAMDLVSNEELLEDRAEELSGQVTAHEERATHLEEHATHLEEHAARLVEHAANLEGRAAELEERCANLEERCAQLEGRAAGLEERGVHLEIALKDEKCRSEEARNRGDHFEQVVEELTADGVRAALEREGLVQAMHVLNVTLGEKQRSLDLLRGELTNERNQKALLQGMLRDRWANFMRALGLK
ncbi:MAG: phage shock protein A [Planctomycetota bacterium]